MITKARGGTAFMIHKSIVPYTVSKQYKKNKVNGKSIIDTRLLLLKIQTANNKKLKIANVYLPSNSKRITGIITLILKSKPG